MNNPIIASKQVEEEVRKLFELGAHLGHKKNRLHPKARKYLYKVVNSVSIIDLTKTVDKFLLTKKFLNNAAKEQKTLLVVTTKKIVNQFVADICKENKIPHITAKWLPGLLTNFTTIIKNVKKLQDLKTQRDQGEWDKFVKHERLKLNKDLIRLEKFYDGIIDLIKKPDIMIIVDSKKEKNALTEARMNTIPVIGIIDTNSDPDLIDFPIIVNDDSSSVLQYVIKDLIGSYVKGKEIKS